MKPDIIFSRFQSINIMPLGFEISSERETYLAQRDGASKSWRVQTADGGSWRRSFAAARSDSALLEALRLIQEREGDSNG